MSLISFSSVSLRFDAHALLERADLNLESGDRMAIVGRNGCGKSSLLKLMAGLIEPDSGLIEKVNGLKCAYLPQEVPVGLSGQGSDCLGFDDEFSRDHDYGPGFLIWLSDEDCVSIYQKSYR